MINLAERQRVSLDAVVDFYATTMDILPHTKEKLRPRFSMLMKQFTGEDILRAIEYTYIHGKFRVEDVVETLNAQREEQQRFKAFDREGFERAKATATKPGDPWLRDLIRAIKDYLTGAIRVDEYYKRLSEVDRKHHRQVGEEI